MMENVHCNPVALLNNQYPLIDTTTSAIASNELKTRLVCCGFLSSEDGCVMIKIQKAMAMEKCTRSVPVSCDRAKSSAIGPAGLRQRTPPP